MGTVAAEEFGSPPDGMSGVEVASQRHGQSGAGCTAGLFGDLQTNAVEGDGVVAMYGTNLLMAKDGFQVGGAEWSEAKIRMGRRAPELIVVGGQEAFDQIAIGAREGADPSAVQRLWP